MRVQALLLSLLAACAPLSPPPAIPVAPPPTPDVALGPAASARPAHVLVLGATCGSPSFACPAELAQAVDNIVIGGLEQAGYAVIDSTTLLAQTRQRHEEHEQTEHGSATETHSDTAEDFSPFDTHGTTATRSEERGRTDRVVLDGPTFEDLSLDDRRALLAKTGADAVASIRVHIETAADVEVQVKLAVGQGEVMAWVSRCTTAAPGFVVIAPLETAARCAVRGGTQR